METKRRLPLHTKILIGLVLGALAGWLCQWQLGTDHEGLKVAISDYIQPIGNLFLSLIFMVVVPLLFSALVNGIAEIGDARKVGRIGARSILMTVILSGIAVALGIFLVNAVKPGAGISQEQRTNLQQLYAQNEDAAKKVEDSKKAPSVVQTLVDFVPRNPLQSAVNVLEGGLIAFMVFALFFGIALASVEAEKALPLKVFFEGLFAVCLRIIAMAMKFAPIGVFALIFKAAAQLNGEAFMALGKYAILVIFALAVHMFIVYSGALKLVAKRSPRQFFGQVKGVMMTAFATSSSNATLPAALKSAEEDVGLPRDISSFVLTVGATANQNGTALFEGITVLFLAQLYGISLDLTQQLVVMGWSIVAGIGTAGVPGGSWPMIAIILTQVGVPAEAIGLCLGIDRILDMSRTTLNVTGDIVIAACVTEMEGRSNELPVAAEG